MLSQIATNYPIVYKHVYVALLKLLDGMKFIWKLYHRIAISFLLYRSLQLSLNALELQLSIHRPAEKSHLHIALKDISMQNYVTIICFEKSIFTS